MKIPPYVVPHNDSLELHEYEIRMYGADVFYAFSQYIFVKIQKELGDPFGYIRQIETAQKKRE